MKVNQLYTVLNPIFGEILGESAVLAEDLSNVVDMGTALYNANQVDNYVNKLVDRIGKTIFVDRVYQASAPSVLMDKWEYGSVAQKIQIEPTEAQINEDWNLQDGQSYDQNIFYKPKVSVKFFNSKQTFEYDFSITSKQIKESFLSGDEMNRFVSSIYTSIENNFTIALDAMIMRTINNFAAELAYSEFPEAAYADDSGVRCVNLLHLYKVKNPEDATITADNCLTNPEFIRFASFMMGNYIDRLKKISTLFNVEGKRRFTPADKLHCVMLSEFSNAADVYLQSKTFHDKYTALPNADIVPYWQGSGQDYSFANCSDIHVQTGAGHDVELTGVLAVMFDRDALGVTNEDRRTTTNYNAKAEFYSNFAKMDVSFFNDLGENGVVFMVA